MSLNWKQLVAALIVTAGAGTLTSTAAPVETGVCGGTAKDYIGAKFDNGLEFQENGRLVQGDKQGRWSVIATAHNAVVNWHVRPSGREMPRTMVGEPWCEGSSTAVQEIKTYSTTGSGNLDNLDVSILVRSQ